MPADQKRATEKLTASVLVLLTPTERRQLERVAERDGRKLSQQARHVIREHIIAPVVNGDEAA